MITVPKTDIKKIIENELHRTFEDISKRISKLEKLRLR
jgi:hypothetical protein